MDARTFLSVPSYINYVVATNPPVPNETFDIKAFQTVLVDATHNSLNLRFPLSPKDGDMITIIDAKGISETNNITLKPNTRKINNSSSDFIIKENSCVLIFYFYSGNWNLNYGGLFGLHKNADTVDGIHASQITQHAFSTISVSGSNQCVSVVPEDNLTIEFDENFHLTTSNQNTIKIARSDVLDAYSLNGYNAKDFSREAFSSITIFGKKLIAKYPQDSLVIGSFLENLTIGSDVATGSIQTIPNGKSYIQGSNCLEVFLNRIPLNLSAGDYTESSTTAITINFALKTGDLITFKGL